MQIELECLKDIVKVSLIFFHHFLDLRTAFRKM